MKKKLVLSLLVVALLVTMTAVALAIQPPDQYHPILFEQCDEYCVWCTDRMALPLCVLHFTDYCPFCEWTKQPPEPETVTVTVSTTTAVAKTTTGQRLIVRDKADFSGKVLGYLDFGAKVEVLEVEGGFAKVTGNCGGKTVTGYVWSKNLHNVKIVTSSYEVAVPQHEPN